MTFPYAVTVKRALRRLLGTASPPRQVDAEAELSAAEEVLFDRYSRPADTVPPLFILASPRTGSTLLYQLVAKYLGLHFFSNYVTRHFPMHPLVGTVVESAIVEDLVGGITHQSNYGETVGPHEPSEATGILDNWFPHEHPSQTASANIRRGKRPHFLNTISGVTAFTGLPIVIKNAWNCFRVRELVAVFPEARFVWLRRDIVSSSYSTLKARRRQGDPAQVWNSASPANYEEIRRLPYLEQVVEQQYWTNDAVDRSLRAHVPEEQSIEVWYEDIVSEPLSVLERIAERMPGHGTAGVSPLSAATDLELRPASPDGDSDEFERILQYSRATYPELVRR